MNRSFAAALHRSPAGRMTKKYIVQKEPGMPGSFVLVLIILSLLISCCR